MMAWLVWLMYLATPLILSILIVAAVVYIRRTLQLMRDDGDGSKYDQVLDGIYEIKVRLAGITERLDSLEGRTDGRLEGGEGPALSGGEGRDG